MISHLEIFFPYLESAGLGARRIFRKLRRAARRKRLRITGLKTSVPYQTTGTDFAGPLRFKDENGRERKGYLLIFICATILSVHLELTRDVTTFEFLLAFRRFVSRYPSVQLLLSNNGLSFKRAAEEFKIMCRHLQQEEVSSWFSYKSIKWNFITKRYQTAFKKNPATQNTHFLRAPKNPLQNRSQTHHPSRYRDRRPAALSLGDLIFPYSTRTHLLDADRRAGDLTPKQLKAVVFKDRHIYVQNLLNASWKRFRCEYL